MSEIKCVNCGKKLAEGNIKEGSIQIKCKCGTINSIVAVQGEWHLKEGSYTERVSKKFEKK